MVKFRRNLRQVYRLWIGRYDGWLPQRWNDVPPEATALEVAVEGVYSAAQAAAFVEGFNSEMLRDAQRRWAIAIPVTVRYEGDLQPGQHWLNPQVASGTTGSAA